MQEEFLESIGIFEKYIESENDRHQDKDFWDKKAEAFNRSYQQNETEDDFVFSAIENFRLLSSASSVLDIGCGIGRHAQGFSRRAQSYHGIDISQEMIAHAKANKKHQQEDIFFSHGNWQELSKQYDFVFASMSPAVHSIATVKKFCALSKQYCAMSRFLTETDELSDAMNIPYLHKPHNNAKYSYGLINILWHLGYHPQMITQTKEQVLRFSLAEVTKRYENFLNNFPERQETFQDKIASLAKNDVVSYKQRQKRAFIFWHV